MKRVLLTLLFLPLLIFGQVSTIPITPTDNEEIIVQFDATGTELENYTENVYVFTGVTINGNRWGNIIGQWDDNINSPTLIRDEINPNLYTWIITPSIFSYYGVDINANITEINTVFRAADGTLQSRPDIHIPIIASNPPPAEDSWGIIGSSVNGWSGAEIPMVYNETLDRWEVTTSLTIGELKFRANNNWDFNYGDNEGDGILDPSGANIPVSEGYYTITINLNTLEYTIVSAFSGVWRMSPEPGSLKVGPEVGSGLWWSNDAQTLIDRACYFDDTYVFNSDGSFQNIFNNNTWLEPWQGSNGCGIPVYPHDGSNSATYGFNPNTNELTLNGQGAFMGLPKVNNQGELPGVSVPSSITYNVSFSNNNDVMVLSIESVSGVFWTFKLINEDVVYIPDANFELALINSGIDSDGIQNNLIKKSDAESVTELNVNDSGINSLEGIEAFINLQILFCQRNNLTSLDVSKNLALTNLECETNQFTELDVRNNIALEILGCANNQLTHLDLSNNLNLTGIWCTNNNIVGLDLDVNNQLNLYGLSDNPMTYLSVKNGNNHNIIYSVMQNLPNLSCITVDDETADNSNLNADTEISLSSDCGTVFIPDTNFEQSLIDIGIDSSGVLDGIVLRSEVENLETLNLTNPLFDSQFGNPLITTVTGKIRDLTGIEAFTSLTYLSVGYGELTSIDLSANTLLDELFINDNQLVEVDLSNNVLLRRLGVMRNPIEGTIEVNHLSLLEELFVHYTNISTLDVSDNPLLWWLYADATQLTGIDLRNNSNLRDLRARYNHELVYLNIRNGNNLNVTYFSVNDTPLLNCVTADDVVTPNMELYSEDPFNVDCGTVYIPDENFEQALLERGIDTDGELNHLIARADAEAQTGKLGVKEKSISDLTGLEAFVNITELDVGENQISHIDISNNTELLKIWAYGNQLTSIDFSNNTIMQRISIGRNQIAELDVSMLPDVHTILASSNQIERLDLTNNPLIDRLSLGALQLKSLDLSNNPVLTSLVVSSNPFLTNLDLRNGNNEAIDKFWIGDTPNLSCINADAAISQLMTDEGIIHGKTFSEDCGDFVSIPDENFEQALLERGIDTDGFLNQSILRADAEAQTGKLGVKEKSISDLTGLEAFVNITELDVGENQISHIDISNNTELLKIWAYGNQLTSIDFSNNTIMQRISIGRNQIAELDVSMLPDVHTILASSNQIERLDLTNNPLIDRLSLGALQLKSLDLSNNPVLTSLVVSSNPFLTNLDLRNGNNEAIDKFWIGDTPNLSCINADAAISQLMTDEGIIHGKTFSEDCGDFVSIPDENFELSLLELEIDTDGFLNQSILRADAETVLSLNLTNPNFDSSDFANSELSEVSGQIEDLTGIEAFVNLTNLQLGHGLIDEINVSSLIQLEELFLNNNLLESIDVTQNTQLKRFGVMYNPFVTATIDVSQNILLEELFVHGTGISDLNVSFNPALWKLFAQDNNLTSLDISANTNMQWVRLYNNQITLFDISANQVIDRVDAQYNPNLDLTTDAVIGNPTLRSLNLSGTGIVSNNYNPVLYPNLEWLLLNDNNIAKLKASSIPLIKHLFIQNNVLTELDLSGNEFLERLFASNNQITTLNLKNTNNLNITELDVTNNMALCIDVDDADSANANLSPYDIWNTDVGVLFSLDCGAEPETVLIPDSNFEAALGIFDSNGPTGNILLSDALDIINLDVNAKGIDDLTGIEAFENLITLDVSNNNLVSILFTTENYNGPTNLEELNVSGNLLSELIIPNGRDLISFIANNNLLQTVNLIELTNLEELNLSQNAFTYIGLNDNDQLQILDISNNLSLTDLNLINGSNEIITYMNASNNTSLMCFGVDDPVYSADNVNWLVDDASIYNSNGDCIAPTVLTLDIEVELDRNGLATINVSDVDNGSFDDVSNSNNLNYSLNVLEFDCTNLGINQVELSITDEAGNVGVGYAEVTVLDNTAPEASTIRVRDPFDLNGSNLTLNPNDFNDGSSDNCGIDSISLSQTYFTLPGIYFIDFIVTDTSGNTDTDQLEIEIIDSSVGSSEVRIGNVTIVIHPNPFDDNITLNFSRTIDFNTVSIGLTDFVGNPITTTFAELDVFNLRASGLGYLGSGNYILSITIGNRTRTVVLVKS